MGRAGRDHADDAAKLVHAHPAHLVRAFSREYGMPPHRYLTGRRVDLARRYLLDGHPPAEVATLAGFYDQSHLNRHFRRMLGVTPAPSSGVDLPLRSPGGLEGADAPGAEQGGDQQVHHDQDRVRDVVPGRPALGGGQVLDEVT